MVQIARKADPRVTKRRREILLEASKAFRQKGFHATGMRDIAARLGMTVGNLYYYFRNKQDVLAFCQLETLGRLEALSQGTRALGLRADAELYAMVVGHVLCLNTGAQGSLAHLEVPEVEDGDGAALMAARDRYEADLREVLARGRKQGVFDCRGEAVAAMAILGAVNWTVRWFRPDGNLSAVQIGEDFAKQLVSGLLAPGYKLEKPKIDWEHSPFLEEHDG